MPMASALWRAPAHESQERLNVWHAVCVVLAGCEAHNGVRLETLPLAGLRPAGKARYVLGMKGTRG